MKPVFTTKPTCILVGATLLQCRCDGVGIPDPSIKWIVKGETNDISTQSQLNISLNKDTEGNYTCLLTNENGDESEHLDISKYGKLVFLLLISPELKDFDIIIYQNSEGIVQLLYIGIILMLMRITS